MSFPILRSAKMQNCPSTFYLPSQGLSSQSVSRSKSPSSPYPQEKTETSHKEYVFAVVAAWLEGVLPMFWIHTHTGHVVESLDKALTMIICGWWLRASNKFNCGEVKRRMENLKRSIPKRGWTIRPKSRDTVASS